MVRQLTAARQGRSCDYTCNPDFNIAQVGVITRWTPVKNLTFSAEVVVPPRPEVHGAADVLRSLRLAKPAALYEFKDQTRSACNFALSVTSDLERLEHQENPRQETAGGFSLVRGESAISDALTCIAPRTIATLE